MKAVQAMKAMKTVQATKAVQAMKAVKTMKPMKPMKTMKMIAVLIAVNFIAASCGSEVTSNQKNSIKIISLESAIGNEQIVNLSEVASAVDYIPLETSTESLVGRARHIVLENDVIYLPEGGENQKLSRFSLWRVSRQCR